MNEFIEEMKLKFSEDVDIVAMNAAKGLYSLDDMIEILYLYIHYTDNSFINRERFAETAHYIGVRTIISKMHEIHYNYERYKKQLENQEKDENDYEDEDNENA